MTNNKDYLSQEEIDALLRHTSEEVEESANESTTPALQLEDYITPIEQDALGEIGNITFGSAATALSTLLGRKVEITTPSVTVVERDKLREEFPQPHVAVHVNYVDGFQGINLLVIKTVDAQVIADLMLGGDGKTISEPLEDIHLSAVQEAMNQMMGSSATSMSTIFNRFVNISPPGIDILDLATGSGVDSVPNDEVMLQISFRLTIGDLIDSSIMQLLPIRFAKEMVNSLMGDMSTESMQAIDEVAPTLEAPPAAPPEPTQQPAASASVPPQPNRTFASPPPTYQQQQQGYQRQVNVQPVQYTEFDPGSSVHADEPNLNLLLDIPLRVTVELGRTKKQIKEILELSQGSIIELDKLAGEPVDILVNNKLIAKGEVVVIDENFGVRVIDIVNQMDRIQKIQP